VHAGLHVARPRGRVAVGPPVAGDRGDRRPVELEDPHIAVARAELVAHAGGDVAELRVVDEQQIEHEARDRDPAAVEGDQAPLTVRDQRLLGLALLLDHRRRIVEAAGLRREARRAPTVVEDRRRLRGRGGHGVGDGQEDSEEARHEREASTAGMAPRRLRHRDDVVVGTSYG